MRLPQLILVPIVVVTACSGTTVFVPPGGTCGAYAQAYCQKRQSCSNGSLITRDWGDLDTCLTREALACSDGLAAPHTGQTTARIEQCTAAMPSYSCADVLDGNLGTTCNPIGPGATGSPCTVNAQCSSGYCSNIRYSTCGTCASPPAAENSCATSNCAHDQACVWNERIKNVCEPYVSTGSACGAFSNPLCEVDQTCAGASSVTGVGGTCEPALATVGATCGSKNMGLGCDTTMGLWCTAPPGQGATCSGVTYVGDGMPCGYVGGGVVECTSGVCYSSDGPYFTFAGPSTGTCKAYADDGAACDTASGPQCLSPARCVTSGGATSGVCTVPTASVSAACK